MLLVCTPVPLESTAGGTTDRAGKAGSIAPRIDDATDMRGIA
ncbi:MAG: hypothetical protein R3B47_10950 [Bacteroidia bacterium]